MDRHYNNKHPPSLHTSGPSGGPFSSHSAATPLIVDVKSSAPSAPFGRMPKGFAAVSSQELLDFYAARTKAFTNDNNNYRDHAIKMLSEGGDADPDIQAMLKRVADGSASSDDLEQFHLESAFARRRGVQEEKAQE